MITKGGVDFSVKAEDVHFNAIAGYNVQGLYKPVVVLQILLFLKIYTFQS